MENSKENLDYEQTMNFRTIKAHYTHIQERLHFSTKNLTKPCCMEV